jgi:hypothetical protein
MSLLRIVWSVVIGTIVALLIGTVFDYFRIVYKFETENMVLVYPWVAGVGGLFSAIVASWILSAGLPRPEGKPERSAPKPLLKAAAGKQKETSKPKAGASFSGTQPAAKESTEVPGMPDFDFDKAQAEIKDAADKPQDKEQGQ